MADGHFPTLVSATRDANASTNPLFVRLTDGTTNATFTGSSLNVNITGGATSGTEFAEDAAHTSGDLGSVALVVRKDTIGSNVSADGDYATLLQDANGRLYVQIHDGGNSITVDGSVSITGSVTVTATDLDIRDLAFATDKVDVSGSTLGANSGVDIGDVTINNGSGAAAVNIQDGGNSITVDGTVTATATDLDIRNLNLTDDAVKISANTAANTVDNPIFVQVVSDVITSTEIHNYDTSASIASDSADNHDYTVAGTTFLLKSVIAAFSGGGKVEVQTGPVASLTTKAVAFIPKEGGHIQLNFDPPIEVPSTSTGTVRVIRTNRQGAAQDVYSTIIGNDIP